ncbi:MAG: DCC1-like thiol-disulfide oxidoreductase family protein [Elusimicrobiota bacterium]|jgi:predicted DCC family thiol-disulfide oxidoreductase YuxK
MMLIDGDCRFCKDWIGKLRQLTAGRVDYAPYQEALASYPQVTEKQCREAVQLMMPDGSVYSGARAVFKALALSGRYSLLSRLYDDLPLFGRLAESFYQTVAHHRGIISRLSR